MSNFVESLKKGQSLSFEESKALFNELMEGKFNENSIIEILESLVKKGATEEEALEIYDETLSEAERSDNSPIWIDDTGV